MKKLKRLLITGADGFIGSHLTELAVYKGYKVTAMVQYNSNNYWGWLDNINCKNKIKIISGDIRDQKFCDEATKNIDVVIHLAALIAIPYSYKYPSSFVETNVLGTLNLCNASLKNKIKKFVHTSTSEVYGTPVYVPINEKHPLIPQSPYSATKIGADALALSFYYSFGLPLLIARPFNTYGPRQSARAVIPTIITQILNGKKMINLGNTSTKRDFNYVGDVCEAFLALIKASKTDGKTINIGAGKEYSIKEIFSMICKLTKSNSKLVYDKKRVRPEKSEVLRLLCDNRQLVKLTNYKSKTKILDGLQKTIKWFSDKKNLSLYKTDIYNL